MLDLHYDRLVSDGISGWDLWLLANGWGDAVGFFSAPLQPQQEREKGLGKAEKAGGELWLGGNVWMGTPGRREALTLSLKVTPPQGGSRKKARKGDGRKLGEVSRVTFCCHLSVFRSH